MIRTFGCPASTASLALKPALRSCQAVCSTKCFAWLPSVFLYFGDVWNIVRNQAGRNISSNRFYYVKDADLRSSRSELRGNSFDCFL